MTISCCFETVNILSNLIIRKTFIFVHFGAKIQIGFVKLTTRAFVITTRMMHQKESSSSSH